MTTRPDTLLEFRLERDDDLLSGAQLARIVYRRKGVRRWSKFVVVLDDETTFAQVKENAETIILLHEKGVRTGAKR